MRVGCYWNSIFEGDLIIMRVFDHFLHFFSHHLFSLSYIRLKHFEARANFTGDKGTQLLSHQTNLFANKLLIPFIIEMLQNRKLFLIFGNLSEYNILNHFLQSLFFLINLLLQFLIKFLEICFKFILTVIYFQLAEISNTLKLRSQLLNCDSLMIDTFILVLMIKSFEAITTNKTIQLTEFIITD